MKIRRSILVFLVTMNFVTFVSWGLSYTYIAYNSANYIWRLFNGTFRCQERASKHPRTLFTWYGYETAREYSRGYGIMSVVIPGVYGQQYRHYILPLWVPAVVFSGLAMFVYAPIRRRRIRRKRGLCTKCGYDLRGNESNICSECGEPAGDSQSYKSEPTT